VYKTNKAQRTLTVTLKKPTKNQGMFRHTQSADIQ